MSKAMRFFAHALGAKCVQSSHGRCIQLSSVGWKPGFHDRAFTPMSRSTPFVNVAAAKPRCPQKPNRVETRLPPLATHIGRGITFKLSLINTTRLTGNLVSTEREPAANRPVNLLPPTSEQSAQRGRAHTDLTWENLNFAWQPCRRGVDASEAQSRPLRLPFSNV